MVHRYKIAKYLASRKCLLEIYFNEKFKTKLLLKPVIPTYTCCLIKSIYLMVMKLLKDH